MEKIKPRNFFDRMQALDRRYIYLVVALSIILPLIIPFNSKTYVTEPTENVYKKIDSYAGRKDRAILMCFSHDASTMAELFPMEVAILRHCFERKIPVFTICFMPAAKPLMDYAIMTAKEDYNVQSGIDYLSFGYKPYGLFLPILLGMGDDISEAVETDDQGRKIDSLPIMKEIRNYNEMNLVIDFAASAAVYSWIIYARAKFGVNVAAGITAVMAADNYPYLQTGQLTGMLSGLKGAAEYEKLVDIFATHRDENGNIASREFSKEILKETWIKLSDIQDRRYKTARIGMNAQTVAHVMIIVFILLGNVGYFVTRKKDIEPTG
ncbi:MAG: hypothetical protein JW996_01325 [Candidatus Cloacimonetes bacterium]|nr:hypothetical protein [Candidatus Cloacimonadota bacterium]